MDQDDSDAWEEAIEQWQRPYQEEAFAQLDSLHWWVRHHYNLLPTDPRYLNLTEEELRVEYWLTVFEHRRARAEQDNITLETLDDYLSGGSVEEKFAALKRQSARQVKKEQREKQLREQAEATREPLLRWKADG